MGHPTHVRFGDLSMARRNNFDFLRFFLASLVLVSHSFPLLEGDNTNEALMVITRGQVTAGEVAVSGFFILSGFLIAQSWENSRTPGSYFKKRALRVYPGFLVAVLVSALVIGPLIASNPGEYWRQFSPIRFLASALNLELRLPEVFTNLPHPGVNGSLWSIRYEFCCYIGVAALGGIHALRNRSWTLAAFITALGLYAGQLYGNQTIPGSSLSFLFGYPDFWPRLGASFLAGVVFYLYRDRIGHSFRLFVGSLAALGFFAAVYQLKALPLALPVFGTYVLFYLAYLPNPWLHGFARRGDVSYGIYLYAFPIQQVLVRYCGGSLHPATLALLAFPVTGLCACLSWYLVEKRFMVKKHSEQFGSSKPT
jgi:peptidoglycan/LPS O-acetylase OafA/YrhL